MSPAAESKELAADVLERIISIGFINTVFARAKEDDDS